MGQVPYSVETLPTISDRQTDDRQTDGRTITYSERELKFTFAKNLSRVVFVGGKAGNFPVTGSYLPPHWFV